MHSRKVGRRPASLERTPDPVDQSDRSIKPGQSSERYKLSPRCDWITPQGQMGGAYPNEKKRSMMWFFGDDPDQMRREETRS
ncbi:hypothetical protein Y032_0012g1772 [Ancylostoma ceylanicum]|uniref:Uncharacterized protein n=1 Tax=Ancylostoma ceylanicum TaxID=53326 RepID=A0A016VDW4_9BILA|nr:hypothetical protein Y032_0012g1772 [Ancylostoma ceylanicum]